MTVYNGFARLKPRFRQLCKGLIKRSDKQAVISRVRSEREGLARTLKEHAGIRRRVVEDLYPDNAHFIFELLQNAEDTRATEVDFVLSGDCLSFEHNGDPFTEGDILGITDIGEGTKSGDTIGRFGVGFKSVFAYTDSPRIWSPTYSFRIDELVLPALLDDRSDLNDWTRFEFPFNNAKKPQDVAFKEIENGLRDLAVSMLLFLNHLQSISWKVGEIESGVILRIKHTDNHIEILKKTNGTTDASSHYLIFSQPVKGPKEVTQHKVAIAFALEFLPDVREFRQEAPIAKQLNISPVQGQVAVFFPAKKETSGLRFNLHAPFVPELSRASVKDTPANEPLFEQLAALCAAAMHDIKDLGFLSRDFLGVLPNTQDSLGNSQEDDRYNVIRSSIIKAFNEQSLMLTFTKTYAPAKHLYQAKASLKELLSPDDIEFLIDYDEVRPQWAANRDLQGTLTERFMSGLKIRVWGVDVFLATVAKKTDELWSEPDEDFMTWLSGKSVEWRQHMYAIFFEETKDKQLAQLLNVPIVKLSNGTWSAASKCYFPDEQRRYTDIMPCVDPEVFEIGDNKARKQAARNFLKKLGVKEINEHELVKALLEKGYTSEDHPLQQESHAEHLKRFMKLASDEPSASSMLENYNLFLGVDGKWHPAKQIYLDMPYADTGLSDYYDIVELPKGVSALAEFYKDPPIDTSKLVCFIGDLGAQKHLTIQPSSCRNNPEWGFLSSVPGKRYTSRSNVDYRIVSFNNLVAAKSVRVARLIWNTMSEESSRGNLPIGILQAQYRKNLSSGTRYAHSQVVHQLRNAEWVPQGDRFVRPAAARAEILPDGFKFDPGWAWLKAVEFGKDVRSEEESARDAATDEVAEKQTRRQTAAAELGFKSDDLAWLERFLEVPANQREGLLAEWEKRCEVDLPEHEPHNPPRRAERVGEKATKAPERRTEEKTRSVSVGREEVKEEAGQYLQQQYAPDDDVICQACKKPMPFKLDDGSVYFEKVEFLAQLKKRHHQNYLALCPNHAAMFRHANGTRDIMLEMFCDFSENKLEVVLAKKNETIYFTKTHIADLRKVIEIDQGTDG